MMQRSPCCCAFSPAASGYRRANTWRQAAADHQQEPGSIVRTFSSRRRNSSSVSAAPGSNEAILFARWRPRGRCRFTRPVAGFRSVSTGTCSSASRAARCSPVAPPTGKMAVALPPRKVTARATIDPAAARFKYRRAAAEVCLPGRSVGFAWRYPARGQRERVNFGHSFSSTQYGDCR